VAETSIEGGEFRERVLFRLGAFRFVIHHLGSPANPYMLRWILKLPWGSVRLHKICRSDVGLRALGDVPHDHPFDFVSLLLTGGYVEERFEDGVCRRLPWPRGSIVWRRAEDLHRLVLERPVWTIVVTGPNRRRWGFETPAGWVDASERPPELRIRGGADGRE
jgi:hypothetical protein